MQLLAVNLYKKFSYINLIVKLHAPDKLSAHFHRIVVNAIVITLNPLLDYLLVYHFTLKLSIGIVL